MKGGDVARGSTEQFRIGSEPAHGGTATTVTGGKAAVGLGAAASSRANVNLAKERCEGGP